MSDTASILEVIYGNRMLGEAAIIASTHTLLLSDKLGSRYLRKYDRLD